MTVTVSRVEDVAVITINRPEVRNAVDGPTAEAFQRELAAAEQDATVTAIVITAAGKLAFCSGVDLREFSSRGPVEGVARVTSEDGFCGLTRHFSSKPLVAAVNGVAVAGGWELALACDLIVASQSATFSFNEVARGMVADEGGCLRLPGIVGPYVAREIVLTGTPISADRAERLGLVNRVVPAADLLDAAVSLATLVGKNAPIATQGSRKLIDLLTAPSEEAWAANDAVSRTTNPSADAQEGSTAYTENRDAIWTAQ